MAAALDPSVSAVIEVMAELYSKDSDRVTLASTLCRADSRQ